MIGDILGVGLVIAGLAFIATGMIIREHDRHSLFPDDGIVWNPAIEERMKKEK